MPKQKTKILVIEDDDYARDALARLLAAEGYETESSSDGQSGFAWARELQPDVIILDLSLPGIDGKRLIRMIRGDQNLRWVPILVVTGHDTDEAQSAVDIGADGYLTKPVEFDELTSAISGLKERRAASVN
jgi:two-component system, sensor histidine kinase and response regulator